MTIGFADIFINMKYELAIFFQKAHLTISP